MAIEHYDLKRERGLLLQEFFESKCSKLCTCNAILNSIAN